MRISTVKYNIQHIQQCSNSSVLSVVDPTASAYLSPYLELEKCDLGIICSLYGSMRN